MRQNFTKYDTAIDLADAYERSAALYDEQAERAVSEKDKARMRKYAANERAKAARLRGRED